jgi:hypothetical protein
MGFTHLQTEWNPWLRGYRPQIPILSALSSTEFVEPPKKNSWVRHCDTTNLTWIFSRILATRHSFTVRWHTTSIRTVYDRTESAWRSLNTYRSTDVYRMFTLRSITVLQYSMLQMNMWRLGTGSSYYTFNARLDYISSAAYKLFNNGKPNTVCALASLFCKRVSSLASTQLDPRTYFIQPQQERMHFTMHCCELRY